MLSLLSQFVSLRSCQLAGIDKSVNAQVRELPYRAVHARAERLAAERVYLAIPLIVRSTILSLALCNGSSHSSKQNQRESCRIHSGPVVGSHELAGRRLGHLDIRIRSYSTFFLLAVRAAPNVSNERFDVAMVRLENFRVGLALRQNGAPTIDQDIDDAPSLAFRSHAPDPRLVVLPGITTRLAASRSP